MWEGKTSYPTTFFPPTQLCAPGCNHIPVLLKALLLLHVAPFVNYSFVVAGVNEAGFGPFSDPVYFMTREEGEH